MSETLSAAWDECQNMCDTWVYETLGAEIDRLTAELEIAKLDYELLSDDYKQLQLDVLNARERNNSLTAELAEAHKGWDAQVIAYTELKIERDRYREALERIARVDYVTRKQYPAICPKIAREALNESEIQRRTSRA